MEKTSLSSIKEYLILDTCILAGQIMMESGAEMYRVEDTMNRIAEVETRNKGISFVTPTGIFMTLNSGKNVRMQRIGHRINNLEKISKVNDLSRAYSGQQLTLDDLNDRLRAVDRDVPLYSSGMKFIAATVISGFMMILFKGVWADFWWSCGIGLIGYLLYHFSGKLAHVRFLPEFIAAFVVGFLTLQLAHFNFIENVDKVIIGGIMVLVPGVPITNAVRDFLAGNSISGTISGMEAMLIAFMIGMGISFAFLLLT